MIKTVNYSVGKPADHGHICLSLPTPVCCRPPDRASGFLTDLIGPWQPHALLRESGRTPKAAASLEADATLFRERK